MTFNFKSGKAVYPGVLAGTAAFFMNFILLKENRVVEGSAYSLFHGTPSWVSLLILLLLSAVLATGQIRENSTREKIQYLSGCLLLALTLSGLALSPRYLDMGAYPHGRISLSAGSWMLLLSSFLLMNSGNSKVSAILRVLPWTIMTAFILSGSLDSLGILKELANERSRFTKELGRHLYLSLRSVLQAVAIGIPLGVLAWKRRGTRALVFAIINSLQTIPSLALFGILIPPLAWISFRFPFLRELGFRGVGQTPALMALTLYALLPVCRNTFASLSIIEHSVLDAGKGMGMTGAQLFWKVELPIGLPIILSGVRIAVVQTTGNTTVAALIGAGGLGFFVFRGLEQAAPDLILMGVIPIILLVTLMDKTLGALIRVLTPQGLEQLYDSI